MEKLIAQHGSALCRLASIILADREEGAEAVSRLLHRVCSRPLTTPDQGTRRQLSRRLYLNCTWTKLVSGHTPELHSGHHQSDDGFSDTIAKLGTLSEQQRAAIGLFIYGDHTYEEVAELISLPTPVASLLLRSGLDELCR